jgi:hypothetical protein
MLGPVIVSDPHWIRIRIRLKGWIRIRYNQCGSGSVIINADPKHW